MLEFGEVESFPGNVEQIVELVVNAPGRADAEVVEFAGFVCCVPALDNVLKLRRLFAALSWGERTGARDVVGTIMIWLLRSAYGWLQT